METGIPARLTAAEGRKFGLTVGIAFVALAGVMVWRGFEIPAYVFGATAGLLIIAGLLIPGHLGPVYRGWMAFGLALSKVTTPVILGILYYGVLAPAGLLRRTIGHNPVKRVQTNGSYWIGRPSGSRRKSNLQRQF